MGISSVTGPELNRPRRRLLRAYAFDPMSTRLSGRFLTLDIPFEPALLPGPQGDLIQVVDYDPEREQWYALVDLDDPTILAQDGLEPREGDPRVHQQIVYAVAMSVIERFERYLGRRFRFRGRSRLRIVPHAFEGRNAYFDPTRNALLFGYYRANAENSGPTLPGQMIFTCLSSDIIAHELTHALADRLRPHYRQATNVDVFAWHEAFADLIALFQHFAYRDVVFEAITATSGEIHYGSALFDLAAEFGQSCGRGAALRSAIESARHADEEALDTGRTRRRQLQAAEEPHERGACFVAAVFEAYLDRFRAATADLIRIATNGTGELPPGRLHPDLVARVTTEAVVTADQFLGIVIRAYDYLPPVDVTFGDVVRAIVTSDSALYPRDGAHLRSTLVEAFRRRGIYPDSVTSLSDDALAWPTLSRSLDLNSALQSVDERLCSMLGVTDKTDRRQAVAKGVVDDVKQALLSAADDPRPHTAHAVLTDAIRAAVGRALGNRRLTKPSRAESRQAIAIARRELISADFAQRLLDDFLRAGGPPPPLQELVLSSTMDLDPEGDPGADPDVGAFSSRLNFTLKRWAQVHAAEIGLDPDPKHINNIRVEARHVAYRRAGDGQPRPEILIGFTQRRRDLEDEPPAAAGSADQEEPSDPHRKCVQMLAGTTLIVRPSGEVKHVIAKPLPYTVAPSPTDDSGPYHFHLLGMVRLAAIRRWVAEVDLADALSVWDGASGVLRLDFASLHHDAYAEQTDADDD